MADFAQQKHQFKEYIETTFDERADTLQKISAGIEARIKTATEVFDQKVKDNMLDLNQAMDKNKFIHQKIMERAEANDTFQQEMKQSQENARLMNDRLQDTIDLYNPLNTKFANFIVAIREQRASLLREITMIKE